MARPEPAMPRRGLLVDAARTLLTDLDCTGPSALRALDELSAGASLVRVAHQPNLFPYDQMLAQTVHIVEAARALRAFGRPAVAAVFLVDYDVCGDKRIAKARAFDPRRTKEQLRHFSHVVPRSRDLVAAFRAPPPDALARHRIERELVELARSFDADPAYVVASSGVRRNCRSLADFNAFSWANLVINLWDLPIVFLRLSDVASCVEHERRELAARLAASRETTQEDELWSVCAGCGRRVRPREPCCAEGHLATTVPKVDLDDLSDHAIYGISGGSSYEPGWDHLVRAHRRGLLIGIEPAPESCWRLPERVLRDRAGYARTNRKESEDLLAGGRNSLVEIILDPGRAAVALAEMRALVAASFT